VIGGLGPYPAMKDSGVPWLGEVPEHWATERAKWLFRKMARPVRESDEVVTCFRDGTVTLRRNRRVRGFTESLKEIGYQGIRRDDLVIHAMDAFAGAVGVADTDGKSTPVYSVCEPGPRADSHFYAYAVREMARSQWILALAKGIRERSTDFRFEAFGSQEVPLPPLAEQAAIVRFLDHADRRIRRYIRAKQKLIELLEEQKQAIIHRAVTRTEALDPCRSIGR
jgi:type I restriction enzyme, S subunit